MAEQTPAHHTLRLISGAACWSPCQEAEHLQAGEGELGWLAIHTKFCDN